MKSNISITEFGVIRNARDFPDAVSSLDEVYAPDETFQLLKQVATNNDDVDALLTFFVKKNREAIQIKNYVGLIELPDGTQIEILPKIGAEEPETARMALLNMLRHLRQSPFRTMSPAHTSATRLPLWEIFVTTYLDMLSQLISQGLQRTYVTVEGNERFWKGKLQLGRHLRENAQHAERLAVCYDTLTADIPPNRLLKAALVHLQNRTMSGVNQRRIQQVLWALEDVPVSVSVADDLRIVKQITAAHGTAYRQFQRYKPALQWAEALLCGQAFGIKTGRMTTFSLLLPMQRVFEDYVSYGFRTYYEDGVVTLQESSAHLVDEHNGAPKFRLRPDILIRKPGQMLVLDMKWQRIEGTDRVGNYGIEQHDLYQLYAYGKKYEADQLFLIYPANETFRQPLEVFGYDESTQLHVVPFDLAKPLHEEIERLARFLS